MEQSFTYKNLFETEEKVWKCKKNTYVSELERQLQYCLQKPRMARKAERVLRYRWEN